MTTDNTSTSRGTKIKKENKREMINTKAKEDINKEEEVASEELEEEYVNSLCFLSQLLGW